MAKSNSLTGEVRPIRVLDLFCGVGGNTFGLKMALSAMGIDAESSMRVMASVEISEHAEATHQVNHSTLTSPCLAWRKSIETLAPASIDKLNCNVWFMSPPCQPFTRQGSALGGEDKRCAALKHILTVLLPQCRVRPRLVYVENVRGFELSPERDELVSALHAAGLTRIVEHLFNPADAPLGWPNSRLRYYLVARLGDGPMDEIRPFSPMPLAVDASLLPVFAGRSLIGDFLGAEADAAELSVPPAVLCRTGKLFDIVVPSDPRCNCFTKNYGRKVEGAGSILAAGVPLPAVTAAFANHDRDTCGGGVNCPLMALGLRYFEPSEVAALMGFPASFRFAPQLTTRQRWMLMGNSVNPSVVACVLFPHLPFLLCQ